MNRIVFAALGTVLFISTSTCQVRTEINCDSIINDYTMKHTGFEPTLAEFISKRILEDKKNNRHIVTTGQLRDEFTLWICNENYATLMLELSKDSVIQITVANKKISVKDRNVISNRKFSPFGKDLEQDTQEIIVSITISLNDKEYTLPTEAYDDLFFPNFCEVNLPVRSIQAFLSNDKKYIYLYIYGKTRYKKESEFYKGFRNSYIAKIVMNLENGYETTIVVPGRILELYNWISCPKKIIFF